MIQVEKFNVNLKNVISVVHIETIILLFKEYIYNICTTSNYEILHK